MKKIILASITLLLCSGIWYFIHPQYYYVKITKNGNPESVYRGKKIYTYTLKGYNKDGQEKELTFRTQPDLNRPFKKNAYLKVIYTNLKQENGYEEVLKFNIPKKALDKIEDSTE
ncbi:YxeA family protein [Enterococcus faecalis]|nr:YxeA family protein [Enterococcus faecalis]EGO5066836.1 YxeA family protein [Enterococcus faecalis]